MADPTPPTDPDRLSSLRRRVDAARGSEKRADGAETQNASSMALRYGGEFGAAILVGALLGYGLDTFAHTGGVALAIGLGLGFAAGVVNVVRLARTYSQANPPDPNAKPIPDDEDD
ncbi:MAG: F0F1 ATP synthase subunit I [Alphaproteobacteria bacterium]|nr:F0F1 ATP synthase subunit I [Alphaproteobacteria bacterium]